VTLVSGNIIHMWLFEGVSCWGVVKPEWGRWNRWICRFPLPDRVSDERALSK